MKFPLAIVFAALVRAAPASAAAERGTRAVSSADEEAARQEAVAARRMEGSMPVDDAKAADADADTGGGDSLFDDAAASAASTTNTKQSTKSSKSKGGGRSASSIALFAGVDTEIEVILSNMREPARSTFKARSSEADETYRGLSRPYLYLLKTTLLLALVVFELMADGAGRRMEERDLGRQHTISNWNELQRELLTRSRYLRELMTDLVTDLIQGFSWDRAYKIASQNLKSSIELLHLNSEDDAAEAAGPSAGRCLFDANQFWAARVWVKKIYPETYDQYFHNSAAPEDEVLEESAYYQSCRRGSPLLSKYLGDFLANNMQLISHAWDLADREERITIVFFALKSVYAFLDLLLGRDLSEIMDSIILSFGPFKKAEK